MSKEVIENRTVTPLGLSIGTGLAVETMFPGVEKFDSARTPPNEVKPDDYDVHIYNVYTLMRNVLSSIKFKDKELLLTEPGVHEALVNDMYLLHNLYDGYPAEIVFYLPNYDNLYKVYNKGKGDVYQAYERHRFMVSNVSKIKLPYPVTRSRPNGLMSASRVKALLLTHYTVDLLNIDNLSKLDLLESHTGKVKSREEWYTKYHKIGKRDLSFMPFHKRLLYILGDGSVVNPLPVGRRVAFYEVTATRGWNQKSSPDMVARRCKEFINDIPV